MKNSIFTEQQNLEALQGSRRLADGRWADKNWVRALKFKAGFGAILILALSRLVMIERPTFWRLIKAQKTGKPVLIVAWHGCMLTSIYCHRGRDVVIMTSLSEDGDLLTQILYNLGYKCVRGSSSRGGMRSLLEMLRLMQAGFTGAITVDGPRGPRHQVKPGAVLLAQKTGALLLPIGAAYSRCLRLNNWDHTRVPLPGSRVVLITGEPFTIAPDCDLQTGCDLIGQKILNCEAEAQEYLATGHLSKQYNQKQVI